MIPADRGHPGRRKRAPRVTCSKKCSLRIGKEHFFEHRQIVWENSLKKNRYTEFNRRLKQENAGRSVTNMWKKRILCLILVGGMLMSFSGCRYSEVLEQIIYDQMREREMDENPPFDVQHNDIENEETNDDLKELDTRDEADREEPELTDQSRTTSGNQKNAQSAPKTVYSPAAASDNGTAQTGTPTVVSRTNDGAEAGAEEIQADNGEGAGGSGEEGTSYSGDNSGATKKVVDAYGQEVEIPENVNTVAAVGQTALLTLMLGGGSCLAASDNNTLSNGAITAAYPELAGTANLWTGNGRAGMTDEALAALIALKPDVVLEISWEGTVSDAQAQQLAANGISYLVLPQMTSLDKLTTAVTTMGQVLGDKSTAGGKNAPKIASDYNAWVTAIHDRVTEATGAVKVTDAEGNETPKKDPLMTLYVDGWDAAAQYQLANSYLTAMSGTGCAYIRNAGTESCTAITKFLGYANLLNTASWYGVRAKTQYMTPLISDYHEMTVSGSLASGVYQKGQMLLERDHVTLGMAGFPSLLVPDASVKAAIENDPAWAIYPHINNGDGTFNSDGFLDSEGHIVRTQISGPYDIKINPKGLFSAWNEGGPEGILESLWAAHVYYGVISEEELIGYIQELYSNFYGYPLSDTDIQTILAGGY